MALPGSPIYGIYLVSVIGVINMLYQFADFSSGNFSQFFDTQSWAFHRTLVEKYGGVAKIYGVFGDQQLYVSDSMALHHILKDQNTFELANWLIQCVWLIYMYPCLNIISFWNTTV